MVLQVNPFKEYIETLQTAHTEEEFVKFSSAFKDYGRIIILGNGGSNAVASHISQDYMKFHNKKVSLFSDPSMITMMVNDYGQREAFTKFLYHYCESDTLVILMSSSGESLNVLNAMKWCEDKNQPYGVLTGFDRANSVKMNALKAKFNYHVDSFSYGVVECCHQIFLHGVV